jgi:hypothetical protein
MIIALLYLSVELHHRRLGRRRRLSSLMEGESTTIGYHTIGSESMESRIGVMAASDLRGFL